MAPPAVKRRKLSHDSDEDSSDGAADSRLAAADDVPSDDDDQSDVSGADVDMDGASQDESGDEEEGHEVDDGDSESGGEDATRKAQSKAPKKAAQKAQKDPRKGSLRDRDMAELTGAYTGEVYKSNMFKLQVDGLLDQIRPRHGKNEAAAEKALRELKAIIEKIPAREPATIPDAERSLIKQSKVAIPFPHPRPPKDAKYTVQYAKPTVINPIGSYPLKTNARTGNEQAIDLVVVMPPILFQDKDYLNYRYFYKKAYYLACIAAGIKDTKSHNFKLNFDFLNGNELHPIVVVQGNGSEADLSSSKYRIQIIPVVSNGIFPEDKTLPEKNCVRPKQTGEATAQTNLKPTPFYNASLRADSQSTSYLKLLHGALGRTDAFRDACLLGTTWLRQRGFSSHIRNGGFGNFEWTAIMALLLQGGGPAGKPLFAAGYSSYQLFKGMLQYLATRDLTDQPHLYQAPGVVIPREEGAPTFFDGPRGLNILYKMMPWAYQLLRREARTTVASLGDNAFDQFDSTFVLKADQPLHRFDFLAEIPVSAFGIDLQDDDHTQKLAKSYQKLYRVLKRGLGDRTQLISLVLTETQPWPLGTAKTAVPRDARILVGFVVDPANAARAVDHGPAAESKKEAAAFRQFWGEKAELRRFKDGSILESLVWSTKDSNASIFEQIVRYVLNRHMSKDAADSAQFSGEQFSRLLSGSGQAGTELFLPFRKAFDTLERDIRGLDGMPLAPRHVFAADSQLRYTSVEVPLALSRKQPAEPANVMIEFEGSARWPDDLKAIQMTKVAFLLKLGELLQENVEGVSTRVGLENQGLDIMNQAFLDVIYPSTAIFRLRIHHDREQTLLERRLKDKNLDASTRETTALALATYKRESSRVPAHTQALQALCSRLPALPPSIRLMKKWFAAHLLSSHFAPELIELMVVRTFLNSYPWEPPTSAATGFLRTLSFLARWDWRNEPLIVDFSSSMKPEEASAINTRYEAWRKIDPALNRVVMFAATNLDPEGTTWTDHARPAKVVGARMSALAKAATQAIRDQGITVDPASLFASSLADYDFVLRINPAFTKSGRSGKKDKSAKQQFKNLVLQADAADQATSNLAGFDPVRLFLAELNDAFGHAVIFFFEENEGDAIAGLWNPANTAKRKWKVRMGYSTVPVAEKGVEGEVEAEVNKEGILAEMARLGGELVRKVEVNRR
ncbi:putative pre-rrna processing protein utp22 protein [Neofusicoccum parvum UCRNP2]|uniref:U3 small nucleolar RNA-associated protein 22 n=1 Tax=Botryosphaeria parva (strain UCR-NP2) TaxID=1287680 RepID=R1EK47_BOTPV|nr:putative pre-rrna processing protein utp22 protein [Neofusicoccum parvum UCRNP2]